MARKRSRLIKFGDRRIPLIEKELPVLEEILTAIPSPEDNPDIG
jgi:hypothetical protein